VQGLSVFENGVAIPYSNAIVVRRKNLGLPEIKTAPIEEIQMLMKETNFAKNILKGTE
jgi:heterodisulfide reductase subunit C